MARPKLELIEGGACTPRVSVSDEFLEGVAQLSPEEAQALEDGLVRAYARAVKTLFDMGSQSYSPMRDIMALTALTEERVTFAIGDFGVVCELRAHSEHIGITALKVIRKQEMSCYKIHNMSRADAN
jgi:hypothetical protein